MSNPHLKNNGFLRFGLTLILIVMIGIINSCRKDVQSKQQQAFYIPSISADIPVLKSIYINAINSKGLQILSVGNGRLNLIRTLDVDWSTYTLQKRQDSSVVAEFDMKNDTALFVPKRLNLGDSIKFINRTTVTFLKFKNGTRLNFFTKIIEDISAGGDRSLIHKVHYMQVPYTFTGAIFYYSLDQQYINGFHYTNGKIDGDISITGDNEATKTTNSLKSNNLAEPCTTYDVYETWCDYGGTVDNPYEFENGCGEKYIGSYTVCDDDNGGSTGGSVSGGGVSGGSNPPPNPCTPTSPPTITESVSNGHLVIENLPAPPTGGGSGGNNPVPCPTTPADVLISNATPVKPCALKFKNITSNWMAVGVSGYKFGIQDNVFGTKFISFNLQIGMPNYVSVQQAQNATAAAMLVAEAYIAQNHGVDFFLSAGAQVTYSKEFANILQAQLIEVLGLPGVQVSNSISAGVPIITYLDNNCNINPQ